MNKTDEFSFILKPSPIGGVGVFTLHDIDQGTWLDLLPKEGESRILKRDQIPAELIDHCLALENDEYECPVAFNHMWLVWYLNHSNTPNADLKGGATYFANRDIKAGEEITIDYNIFKEPENKKADYYHKGV